LCEPKRENTLKHREQKNNRGVVDWACFWGEKLKRVRRHLGFNRHFHFISLATLFLFFL
jgi:hypothetical protein